jgi:hypothetical protein
MSNHHFSNSQSPKVAYPSYSGMSSDNCPSTCVNELMFMSSSPVCTRNVSNISCLIPLSLSWSYLPEICLTASSSSISSSYSSSSNDYSLTSAIHFAWSAESGCPSAPSNHICTFMNYFRLMKSPLATFYNCSVNSFINYYLGTLECKSEKHKRIFFQSTQF